jgi:hypothetical protein
MASANVPNMDEPNGVVGREARKYDMKDVLGFNDIQV